MGFKDDFDEYKQRKEVQKYFRSQNDLYLNEKEWMKVILISLIMSIISGVLLGIVTNILQWNIMYLYILLGYVMAKTVNKVTQVESNQMGILSAVMTLIACIISQIPFALITSSFIMALMIAIGSIVNDMFVLMFVVVACIVAYSYAK